MNPEWRFELLGGFCARRGEANVTQFRTRKAAELLAYLAYYRRRSHPRELLVELLWPEAEVDAGRHNLSMALSFLRQILEPVGVPDGAVLIADRHSVAVNASAVTTDVEEFEAALKAAARAAEAEQRIGFLAAAVDLYRGELLPGHYQDWIFPEQQRLDELFFQTVYGLIIGLESRGELERAIEYGLRAVAANRLREEAYREVIRLYTAAGDRDAALRHYRELERILKQELDTTPSAATRDLLQKLSSGGGRLKIEYCRLQIEDRSGADQATVQPQPAPVGTMSPDQSAILNLQSAISNLPPGLEPVGGAVPLGSRFYVVRPTDEEFRAAIRRRDSIVLVKGPRQVGKTSLLARGLQQARDAGQTVALSHFQTLSTEDLASSDALFRALAETLAEQLDLETHPQDAWDTRLSPTLNFRRFMRREVLGRLSAPLVWGLDEVDRLFTCPFGSEVFGLFRSWHDERALEPGGPWTNLTLAIAYSTEASLFITDLNQSPFNVGTRLALSDFTREQVAGLNREYGSPVRDTQGLERYYRLVGGQPYLVRGGLHEMVAHGTSLAAFEARAFSDDWVFGEHLRRIALLVSRDAALSEAARAALEGRPCPSTEAFYRLRSAGVLAGEDARAARPRCHLYAAYLARHLT